jgi:hypothetical protein
MAVFYKIVKLVKNGVLMIIHIYAKVSLLLIKSLREIFLKKYFVRDFLMYNLPQLVPKTGFNTEHWRLFRLF